MSKKLNTCLDSNTFTHIVSRRFLLPHSYIVQQHAPAALHTLPILHVHDWRSPTNNLCSNGHCQRCFSNPENKDGLNSRLSPVLKLTWTMHNLVNRPNILKSNPKTPELIQVRVRAQCQKCVQNIVDSFIRIPAFAVHAKLTLNSRY